MDKEYASSVDETPLASASLTKSSKDMSFLTFFLIFMAFIIIISMALFFFTLSMPLIVFTSPLWIFFLIWLNKNAFQDIVSSKISTIYNWLMYKSKTPQRIIWRCFYNLACTIYPRKEWTTMNYGFAILNSNGFSSIKLKEIDEPQRFSLQLYYHLATGLNTFNDLKGKTVLEVGCGRGGGIKFISEYLGANKCIGVDFSSKQVDFCRKNFAEQSKLFFYNGDAENLVAIKELQNEKIDAVINVESSHCYGNFKKFVDQVEAILVEGGYFFYTDFMDATDVDLKESILQSGNFKIIKFEDITINVKKSMELDEVRRLQMINSWVHWAFRPLARKFSGVTNSTIYKCFSKRNCLYRAYLLRKESKQTYNTITIAGAQQKYSSRTHENKTKINEQLNNIQNYVDLNVNNLNNLYLFQGLPTLNKFQFDAISPTSILK